MAFDMLKYLRTTAVSLLLYLMVLIVDGLFSVIMFLGYHLLDYYLLVLWRPNDFKFVQRMYKPNERVCKLTCVKGGRLAGRDG